MKQNVHAYTLSMKMFIQPEKCFKRKSFKEFSDAFSMLLCTTVLTVSYSMYIMENRICNLFSLFFNWLHEKLFLFSLFFCCHFFLFL